MSSGRFYRNQLGKSVEVLRNLRTQAAKVRELATAGDVPDESLELKKAMNELEDAYQHLSEWVDALEVMADAENEAERQTKRAKSWR